MTACASHSVTISQPSITLCICTKVAPNSAVLCYAPVDTAAMLGAATTSIPLMIVGTGNRCCEHRTPIVCKGSLAARCSQIPKTLAGDDKRPIEVVGELRIITRVCAQLVWHCRPLGMTLSSWRRNMAIIPSIEPSLQRNVMALACWTTHCKSVRKTRHDLPVGSSGLLPFLSYHTTCMPCLSRASPCWHLMSAV